MNRCERIRGLRGLGDLIHHAVVDMAASDAPGLAAELAYRIFVALFPALLFAAAVAGLIAQVQGGAHLRVDLQREIEHDLPPETARFVLPYIAGALFHRSERVLWLGIVLSIWAVSSAIMTVMKAASRLLGQPEQRSYLERRLRAMLLAFYMPGLLLVSLALTWFRGEVRHLLRVIALNPPLFFPSLRLGAAFLLATLAIGLLLWTASPRHVPFRTLLLGSITTVAGILLASQVFAIYARTFVHYRSTYGLLGGALALLTWLYVSAFCLLAGIEVMGLLERYSGAARARAAVVELLAGGSETEAKAEARNRGRG